MNVDARLTSLSRNAIKKWLKAPHRVRSRGTGAL